MWIACSKIAAVSKFSIESHRHMHSDTHAITYVCMMHTGVKDKLYAWVFSFVQWLN